MSNPWFRMYAEFAHDPKVQMMSEAMQRRYVMLMCMRCSDVTVTLRDDEIAFQLRISETELEETKRLFVTKGFIDSEWNLLNWEKRQFVSDRDPSGAERQKRYREKQKELKSVTLRNAPVTPPDTDTDTDKNKKTTRSARVEPPDGVSVETWQDFQKLRKAKRAPLTQTALDGIRLEADKAGLTLEQALSTCCKRGWQGFEADWVAGNKSAGSPGIPGGLI